MHTVQTIPRSVSLPHNASVLWYEYPVSHFWSLCFLRQLPYFLPHRQVPHRNFHHLIRSRQVLRFPSPDNVPTAKVWIQLFHLCLLWSCQQRPLPHTGSHRPEKDPWYFDQRWSVRTSPECFALHKQTFLQHNPSRLFRVSSHWSAHILVHQFR